MAIVLDINFLCNKILDISIVEEILNRYGVKIVSIASIDNWMWDNRKEVRGIKCLQKILDNNQIAIIYLKKLSIKDLGIYIEKIENFYLYNLWINTEGYPMLDCDSITPQNDKYYAELYQIILDDNRVKDAFEVVGIGLETDIHYSKDIVDIMQKSQNVIVWILNRHIELSKELDGYDVIDMEGVTILEKKQ